MTGLRVVPALVAVVASGCTFSGAATPAADGGESAIDDSGSGGTDVSKVDAPAVEWHLFDYLERRPYSVANGSGTDLTNVKVPVALSGADFDFNKASDQGVGIEFTTDSGEVLNFETDAWEQTSALLWVLVPELPSGAATRFWLYHDHPQPRPDNRDSGAAIWTTELSVYHFGDDLDDGSASDAVGGRTATNENVDGNNQTPESAFGLAVSLTAGGTEAFDAQTVPAWTVANNQSQTVELWFRNDSLSNLSDDDKLMMFQPERNCQGLALFLEAPNKIQARFAVGSGCETNGGNSQFHRAIGVEDGSFSLSDDLWHHVAVSIDRGSNSMRLYLDGAEIANTVVPAEGDASGDGALIGRHPNMQDYFDGAMDEVRVGALLTPAHIAINSFLRDGVVAGPSERNDD